MPPQLSAPGMPRSIIAKLLLLFLGVSRLGLGLGSDARGAGQLVLGPSSDVPGAKLLLHTADTAILAALKEYSDPVTAYISIFPNAIAELTEPRLLQVSGQVEPQWMTEGDKMRLRRLGKKFMDMTNHHAFYAQQAYTLRAAEPHLPSLTHQKLIKPLFSHISTQKMHDVVRHLTSYHNRYCTSSYGEQSATWIYDHVGKIIDESPIHTHISLEYFPHNFRQPSIIARFEPRIRNASLPLTIVGAHQDSINYLFPLLPAPGADDDGSGTVSILEAFRVLAHRGFIPENGPVEFHWYAGEEAGMLGSQDVARYKKESGATIGAMIQFDMTGWIARHSTTGAVGVMKKESNLQLTEWAFKLIEEYSSIPIVIADGPGESDHKSYTLLDYPATMATEANTRPPNGDSSIRDLYIHSTRDRMDVDDENGHFSIDLMANFTELAIAFVVEQAAWDIDSK